MRKHQLLLLFTLLSAVALQAHGAEGKKNVLFLVSDDMRPEITAFDGPDFPSPIHPRMVTPNLDKLAAKSLLLKKAYVQQAVCSPSRTSLLTGRRPDTTHVYDLVHYFRKVGGNFTTIPEYFKDNGYESIGMGKVFHPGKASGYDDPVSWSTSYYHAPNLKMWDTKRASWIAVNKTTMDKFPLPDQQLKDHAIQTLQRLKDSSKPFFLAVGFHKPHLPFVFPDSFLTYYSESDIRLPDNPYAPANMPKIAWSSYGELRAYADIAKLHASGAINTTLPDHVVKDLRRAYYSALSYTDSMIGEVLQELETLGLANNTIVSFWGDHGWQLGEHGEWCKHTNFELATHAPMMVHVPGLTDHGIAVEQLTEYVDLFPTLVDAAGLPPLNLCPENRSPKVDLCREGSSLMPLIKNPSSAWKQRVFSQYPRDGDIMGYTMRTARYRYTEWVKFEGEPKYKPNWDALDGAELYDHAKDAEENFNRAYDPEFRVIRQGLSKMLRLGWRSAIM